MTIFLWLCFISYVFGTIQRVYTLKNSSYPRKVEVKADWDFFYAIVSFFLAVWVGILLFGG